MKIVIHRPKMKICLAVRCFSIFAALMLFQTSYMHLGTITAGASLMLTIAAFFLQKRGLRKQLKLNSGNICLAFFLVYSVLLTFANNLQPADFVAYVAQVVMCLLLFSVNLNGREHEYLMKVFSAAATVYALLIIRSYVMNARPGYSHTDVILFNTKLDPNFACIPMMAASALLLDNILNQRWWKASVVMYLVDVSTVIYLASRSGFVAMLCSNMMVLFFFLIKKRISAGCKLMYLILPILIMLVLIPVLKMWFPAEWERVTEINMTADNGRFRLWKIALEDWLASPFFGNGLGYSYYAHLQSPHNTYLQVLSELGLIGLLLIAGFMRYLLFKTFRVNTTLFCMLLGVLIQLFFLDGLDNRCVWVIFCWAAMLPNRSKGTVGNEKSY